MFLFGLVLLLLARGDMAVARREFHSASNTLTLEAVRESLIRQEDTIIFSLLERAKFPLNRKTYSHDFVSIPGFLGSLVEFVVRQTEVIDAKAGRYENPEEKPFFPDNLPRPVVPPHEYPDVLYPAGVSINLNKAIWDFYFNKLLPLLVADGDDGNYASTAAGDLVCLQALSRRIHFGKYVAEVKFKDASRDFKPPIRSQDRDTLMKLLTFKTVEEMVKKRVAKKTTVFGQEVSLNNTGNEGKYKIDPSVVSRLFGEWVIPLTKEVEVQYLLRRLD